MKTLCKELLSNEGGFILSAEMILILTIAVLGIVVGLSQVQQAVVGELQDLALAFSGLNQSFATPAFRGCIKFGRPISWTAGSGFIDFNNTCIGTGGVAPGGWGAGSGGWGGGYSDISTGSIYSGSICAPAPLVEVPHCAVPHCAPVTTPCVNCPPPAPTSPTPAPLIP